MGSEGLRHSDYFADTTIPLPFLSFLLSFFQLFDEILVNAADNTVRADSGTTRIDVTLDRGSIVHNKPPSIVVRNNGRGARDTSNSNNYTTHLFFVNSRGQ